MGPQHTEKSKNNHKYSNMQAQNCSRDNNTKTNNTGKTKAATATSTLWFIELGVSAKV